MNFSDIAKSAAEIPLSCGTYESPDPDFVRIAKQVARGEKTVDEAWQDWLDHCEKTGKEPVNHKRKDTTS